MGQPIPDFQVSEEPLAKIVGQELLASLGAALLYPFGLRKDTQRTPRRADQRTVVMVHGYLANPSSFLPLRAYLRLAGIRRCLSFRYRLDDGIEAAARDLKKFLRAHVRGGRIDLVCHSLGGLISRVYLQDLGGSRRVDNCITLGTPHRGTYSAYWLPSRIGRALRPDSRLLMRLASTQENAARVRFLAVVGGADNIVVPRVYAHAETATLHVPSMGHLGLLFSPQVFRAVASRLRES